MWSRGQGAAQGRRRSMLRAENPMGQGTFPDYRSQERRRVLGKADGGKGRADFAGSVAEPGGSRPAAVGSKALGSVLATCLQKVVDKELKSL